MIGGGFGSLPISPELCLTFSLPNDMWHMECFLYNVNEGF